MANNTTSTYGLIGKTLSHSFSKSYFSNKFHADGINAEYLNFELPDIDYLMEMISEQPHLRGFNVTIPYKQDIIPYLYDIEPAAKTIGAVNVVKVIGSTTRNNFRLLGFNTDYIGFKKSISPLLSQHNQNALILGTGGASKAIAYALTQLGMKYLFVSRNKKGDDTIEYENIDEAVMQHNSVIINTTPVGMYPHINESPGIPYDLITDKHICYDLTYNPEQTEFLRKAAAQGATTKNGMEMLILQAEASWDIWNTPYTCDFAIE